MPDGAGAWEGRATGEETPELAGAPEGLGRGPDVPLFCPPEPPGAEEGEADATGEREAVLEGVPALGVPVGLAAALVALPAALLAGAADGRLSGNGFASPPSQFASPPSFTTIPTPAIASRNPLSSWNFLISNASFSPGTFKSVICRRPGLVYIKKVYCLLSPVSPTEPGAT